ncbi:MAG: adenylate and Guanylate cyclase catalytic domain protein [Burkholderiales bacterium]|nr:adenylate and Guanylate cyclase catalytic domain protein [Burkholderiales bacterium]
MGLLIVAFFLGHTLDHYQIPILDRFESIIYDLRVRLTMPRTVDDRVVILDIDEKSLQEREQGGEGHWPWPRHRIALLLDKLFDKYGVAVVGFDVVFAERDESSGIRVLEQLADGEMKTVTGFLPVLERIKPQLNYDDIFASRMKGRNVVLGYTFSSDAPDRAPKKGALPLAVLGPETFKGRNIGITSWNGYTANLESLQKAAATAGHFNPWLDEDGVTRRVPMLAEYNGAYYEPLSLAMVRAHLGFPPVAPEFLDEGVSDGYAGLEELKVGRLRIPVDERVSTLVPYRGERGSFKYISIVDVLNERVPLADLKGKIALVGTSAPGLLDLRSTPVGSAYPGVEVHANLIAGILDQNIKHKPPYAAGAEFVLLLVGGLVMTLLLPFVTPLKGTVTALFVFLFLVGTNLVLYETAHIVIPLAAGLAMLLVLFTFNMAYGYFVEARGKRQITGLFGQYVPPAVVDEMAKDPEKASMEGESREMTVLFTDVRGFTTISEGLEPKALSLLMNEFLTPLTEVIYRHRGTIDKYIGDCIMAFWGAPLPDPAHARQAILAALEMQSTLKSLQPQFKSRGWPEIHIGIGLNTGRMSVGNMGSRIRLAYTVMGDAVNLASRLESITKEYGTDIIVGENTREAVSDIVFRELDRVRVKGKDVAVTIFQPVGREGEVEQSTLEVIERFQRGLQLYREQNWDAAERQFAALTEIESEKRACQIFLQRIAILRANPPGTGWDGAFTFETK